MSHDHPEAHGDAQAPRPNTALLPLAAFAGEWRWEASVGGQPIGHGRTLFEWLEGGAFLGQRSDAEQPEFPSGTAIIGADESTGEYCMLYYDSRVVCRIYRMSLSDGVWKLWRTAPGFSQRFTATFSSDGSTIEGAWEKSEDGSHWEKDFDLVSSRVR